MPALIDLTGQVFCRLTVLSRALRNTMHNRTCWECQCICGTLVTVAGSRLRSGNTRSCGCIHKEQLRKRQTTHGATRHGRWIPEYNSWVHMIQRTTNPRHKNWNHYGGRGISMCTEWRHSFAAFFAHVGPKPTPQHSIDRINVNGHYEPGNVRWATPKEQTQNRRKRPL